MPSLRAYNELAEVLGCKKLKKNPVTFKFEAGHCYKIYNAMNKGGKNSYNVLLGRSWEKDCVFRYEGKHGIHHCFREERGGWSRTYTDIQLMGKTIEEVKT